MKTCLVCGETKPLDAFYKRKDSPDGYRNDCKACRNSRHAVYLREVWRPNNPEKVKNAFARWRETNLEYDRERCNRYDAANREQRRAAIANSRAANPEYHRMLGRRWYWTNVERRRAQLRAYFHRRRSGADINPSTDTYAEWLLLQACFYCGSAGPMTIDHVVPISRGGKHVADNLVPACQRCNSSKGAKLLEEWDGRAA